MTLEDLLTYFGPDKPMLVGKKATFHLGKDCRWSGEITAVQITLKDAEPLDVSVFMMVMEIKGSAECKAFTKSIPLPWPHRVTLESLKMLVLEEWGPRETVR